jgi:hypothetical protein
MVVWVVATLVGVTLAGLLAIIVLDVRSRGIENWLEIVHAWQGTIGTVAGFVTAAGILALTTIIQQDADRERAAQAAYAIGHGLAIEAERLVNPLQIGRYIIADIDLEGADVADQCWNLAQSLHEILVSETPVYNAVLSNMMDFGDENLAVFVRFFGNYADFRHYVGTMDRALCDASGADQIRYLSSSINNALGFYGIIAARYTAITPPITDEQIDDNVNRDYGETPA